MNLDNTSLDASIDANVAWLGLTIDPDWRPSIRQNLMALAAAIETIESFPLPDEAEPAAVFEP